MTGDMLKNGAIELLRKETNNQNYNIVLAVFGHQFVTWDLDVRDGVCRSGDYYGDNLSEAINGFNERK